MNQDKDNTQFINRDTFQLWPAIKNRIFLSLNKIWNIADIVFRFWSAWMIEIMTKDQWLKVELLKSPILKKIICKWIWLILSIKWPLLNCEFLFFYCLVRDAKNTFCMSDQSCALFWMPNLKTKSWKESNAHVNF